MNALQKAQNAYRNKAQAVKTDRDSEFDAFARVTSRIKAADARGAAGYNDLAVALYENQRLWTALVGDVASRANRLPKDLRARIVYLSEFTRAHSTKVLRNSATVTPLVEINTAVMRGLRVSLAKPGNEPAQAARSPDGVTL